MMTRTDKILYAGAALALLLAAALALAACATPARAASMTDTCQMFPCVYDATGKLVGLPAGTSVLREINGQWVTIPNVSADLEIVPFATYYYTSPQCLTVP